MSGEHPPLWTWPAALLVSGAVLGAAWLNAVKLEPQANAFFLNTERLSVRHDSLPLVVLVGSSKIRCAVEADSRFEARLASLGTPARVARFSEGLATERDFDDLLKILPSNHPAIVAIESEMVVLEPNVFRPAEAAQYRGWREELRRVLDYRFAPAAAEFASRENRDPAVDDCAFTTTSAEDRQRTLARRRASTPEERAPYYALGRRLAALQVPLVLLTLPDRHDSLGALPPALASAKAAAKGDVLRSGLFMDLGRPPEVPPAEFLDNGHVGPVGQASNSEWLARRFRSLLRQRSLR